MKYRNRVGKTPNVEPAGFTNGGTVIHNFALEFLKEEKGKMKNQTLLDRITINPKVMVGKPTIRGLRITVEQILLALANGVTAQELIEDYPELESEDIHAVLFYATELVSKEQVFAIAV